METPRCTATPVVGTTCNQDAQLGRSTCYYHDKVAKGLMELTPPEEIFWSSLGR